MVIIVASLYAISQLPRHLIYIITVNKPDAFQRDTIIYTWLLCQLSAWSATCYNPIVYIWMSNTFRRGLFDLFKNLCPWIIRCKHHVHHKSKQCAAYHRNSHHHHHHHPHRHHCHHNHHHGSDCSQCYNNHPCPKHQQYFHSLQKTITHPYSSSSSNSKMKKFNQTQNDDSDEYSFNQTENIKMNITENTTIITAVNNTTIHTSYDEDDDDDDDEEEEEEEEQEVYQDGHVKQTRSLHDYDTDLTESDK
ncbi:unnamed protein product [Trichobilharzia regenti]|nr:unnamed protein product [Trichobilharzia regenti]